MTKKITTVHASDIARLLVQNAGLDTVTQMFNQFRVTRGKTKRDRAPVKKATVKRYTGHGQGYEVAPPTQFRSFLFTRIAKKY